MNREIKFRGWDGREMFEVAQITFNDSYWDCSKGRGVSILYQPSISLMQFTGLFDKNNKEIYEGDILLVPDEETIHILDDGSGPTEPFNHIVEVVFQEGSFGIMITDGGNGYNKGFQSPQYIEFYIGDKFSEFEIIGNKYQNPELLK